MRSLIVRNDAHIEGDLSDSDLNGDLSSFDGGLTYVRVSISLMSAVLLIFSPGWALRWCAN